MKDKLLKLADFLDKKRLYIKADMVDKLLSFASDDDSEEESYEDSNPLYQEYDYGKNFEYAKDEDLFEIEGPSEVANDLARFLLQYRDASEDKKSIMLDNEMIYGLSDSGKHLQKFLEDFIETEGATQFDFSKIGNVNYYIPIYIHAIMIGFIPMQDVEYIKETLDHIYLEVTDPEYARKDKYIDEPLLSDIDYEEDYPTITDEETGKKIDLGAIQNIDFYKDEEMDIVDPRDSKIHSDFIRKIEYGSPEDYIEKEDFDDEYI